MSKFIMQTSLLQTLPGNRLNYSSHSDETDKEERTPQAMRFLVDMFADITQHGASW
jgi:hypothetical protein